MTSTLSAPATALDVSCSRLRALNAEYPRMYAVATMADEGKRRWWSLADDLDGDRVRRMWARSLEDVPDPDVAAMQVATALIHAVVGRVTALVVLEGRAWDPGLENLWIHMDSDEGIDWAGVADDTLRVLPDDPHAGAPRTVTVPCERALLLWTVHRSLTSLHAVFDAIARLTPIDASRFWGSWGGRARGRDVRADPGRWRRGGRAAPRAGDPGRVRGGRGAGPLEEQDHAPALRPTRAGEEALA